MPDRDERRREALRQALDDDDVDEIIRLLPDAPEAVDDDFVRDVIAHALGSYDAHAPLLDRLLEVGADLDVREPEFGVTALMLAADAGDLARIERLLDDGVDPLRADVDGETALAYALREGHLRAAERLAAAAGAALDPAMRRRCLLGAAERGRSAVVEELLRADDLRLERADLVQAFKLACAAHEAASLAALRQALRPPLGRIELGEGLLAALRNVRVGDDDETLARRRGVVLGLLQAGADPEIADPADGSSALFYAQEPAIVGALLDAGASPNRRRSDGASPLLVAAGRHDVALMSLLLERGADAHARDLFGRGAAAYAERASSSPHYAKAQALLSQRRVQPQRWTDDRPAEAGAGDWLSVALFVFAIAAIIFGVAVLRCTAE